MRRKRWTALRRAAVSVSVVLVAAVLVGVWYWHDRPVEGTAAVIARPHQTTPPATPEHSTTVRRVQGEVLQPRHRPSRSGRAASRRAAALARERKLVEAHREQLQQPPPSVSFTIATFNTLGASHTGHGGTHADKARGSLRGGWAAQVLLSHGVDVAALQEFERPQAAAFARAAHGAYRVWPGGSSRAGVNSVAWRPARFDLVRAETRSYPYFGGRPQPFPLVLLRDRASGVQFWVTSYHNPASNPHVGNQDGHRHRAVAMEVANANALRRSTGLPLLVAGDMNDRTAFFCPFATGTGMVSASGGSGAGGCHMPPHPWHVDWIMGTPDDVDFSGYRVVRDALVARTSDHPIVLAAATVTAPRRIG